MSLDKNCNDKLQEVLKLFLKPDYNVVTTTYLDLLLNHITEHIKNGNKDITKTIQDWFCLAFDTWNENNKPCQNVATFTLKLIGSVSVKQQFFFTLNQKQIYDKACSVFGLQEQELTASMKMACLEMFMKLLENPCSRQLLIRKEAWKTVLKFAQLNHTFYVTRESHKFLSRLLILESYNTPLCEEIILAVTEPLVKATSDDQVNKTNASFAEHMLLEQNNLLLTTLDLLTAILEYTAFHDLENTIPEMFEELVSLQSRSNVIFEVSISTTLVKPALRFCKLLIFVKLRNAVKTTTGVLDEAVINQFSMSHCYNSTLLLSKKFIMEMVTSKKYSFIYWKKLKKLRDIKGPTPYKFENQVIILMMLPLCVIMKPVTMKHYLFEEFIDKVFEVTCTAVQRLAYSMRDLLLKNDLPLESICKAAVDNLLDILDVMDRETAVIAFQSICHALKSFIMPGTDNNCVNGSVDGSIRKPMTYRKHFLDGDPIIDKPLLLASLLNILNVLTEKFKLKWQECVETICILSIAQDVLNHRGVEAKICTLALKTCNLAIQNFMPPNLALLVDFDEHTKQIGPTLFKRIHDPHWEVQDSVLEILNTIACISENKYPPYQDLLLENEFLKVSVDIIKSDSESYVRASALTFISTAVRINTFWEKALCNLNLSEIAMKLLHNESEAIVRREAAVLLRELYIYRKWPKSMIVSMTQTMTAAAVLDLHWEVKINALEFWRHFIKSHLTDQGMLDGCFPKMTFSKEHRKIVSLDETEIKQRLNKALDELARYCCLGVLLVTLKDESDFEVSKTSANIISELRRILLDYKINEPIPEVLAPKDSATIDTNYKRSYPNTHDETKIKSIIDEIVDANDTNLLTSIYRESMKMDGDESERSNKEMLEMVGKIRRQEFLRETLTFDLDGYLEERSNWLKTYTTSFDSILEDILIISDKTDINSMDCY